VKGAKKRGKGERDIEEEREREGGGEREFVFKLWSLYEYV
jgi:hypothetical protein